MWFPRVSFSGARSCLAPLTGSSLPPAKGLLGTDLGAHGNRRLQPRVPRGYSAMMTLRMP